MRALLATLKLTVYLILCGLIIIPQGLAIIFLRGWAAHILAMLYHRACCRVFGIKIIVKGTPETGAQTLFVSNHLSYLDIPVLGSLLPASFIAKEEVAGWALFGFMSRLQKTLYISRDPAKAKDGLRQIEKHLKDGRSLTLFPEGTSTGGADVLPFKSSLFQIFTQPEYKNILLQPISLRILSVNHQAADNQDIRDLYAWHGDMDLEPHLWQFAKLSGAVIEVTCHPAQEMSCFSNRKEMAQISHDIVQSPFRLPALDFRDKTA